MMEVMVTNGAVRYAKLQSAHRHKQTNTNLFTDWTAFQFLSANEQCQSIAVKRRTCWSSSHVFDH